MDWNKLSEELLKRLDSVGSKLGVTGQYVWAMAVRQSYIEGIEALILVAVGIGLFTAIACTLRKYIAWGEDDRWNHAGLFICGILYVIAVICGGIAIYQGTDIAIRAFGNPEFYALQNLLQQVK